jgi:CHAT domain-containing protein/predicted negative regulator of RcsB-dependent stress response
MLTHRLPYLLLYLLFSFSAFANCPEKPILPIVEAGDRAELEMLAEALKYCPKLLDSLGLVYHGLGVLSYRNGDLEKAVQEMQQAVEYRKKAFAGEAHEDLGRSYFNLGFFYEESKDYGQALTCYRAAADIQQGLNNRVLHRATALRVANMHRYAGDFDKAERLLRWVIEDTQDGETLNQAKARLNLGLLYAERKAYQKAIRQLQPALSYFAQQEMLQDEASTLLNLAKAHYHLGHFPETKQLGSQALAYYQTLEDISYQATVKNLLGLAAMQSQQYPSAKQLLSDALELAQQAEDKEIIAATIDNLGELALQQGKANQAADWFLRAIQTLIPDFHPQIPLQKTEQQHLEKTPYKVDLSIYLNDLLRALLAQYEQSGDGQYVQSAALWLKAGDHLIDQLRSSHSDASTKLFWREEALPFYERAVRICAEQQATADAFYFLEKSQSVLLLEALAEADALSAIPDSLQQQEQALRRQLNRLQLALDQAGSENAAALLDEALAAEQQLERLTDHLSASYPVYQRQTAGAAVIGWEPFQSSYLMGQNRALLHYLFGKERAYLFYANGQKTQLLDLGSSDTLARQVESFLHWFSAPALIEQSPEAYKKQAHALFQKLIPIPTPLKVQALLIIPGGPLAYVPFEALLSAPHPGTDLSTAPYLVNSHIVSYSFSATLYDQLENTTSSPVKQAYAMAPFAKQASKEHTKLQYSPVELEAVAAHFPMQAFQDDAATRHAFTTAMGQATIMHLSTHAFGAYDGKLPYIALADSSVFLTDLYHWDIPAELVVLSACQSNIGRLAQGEGVLGLGRGFFYAGAKSVVASLWNLNDQSTSQVIAAFYTSLAEGQPKAASLQSAKVQYLQDPKVAAFRKSPYYWAGLTYYGDSKPLNTSSTGSSWWWALGLIAILAVAAYFFWQRKG